MKLNGFHNLYNLNEQVISPEVGTKLILIGVVFQDHKDIVQ
ncbi:hypothetical protein Presley_11 [Acinetobacter phage Presley]|uniref:Uncharacterized protein n=1 Tax=Acinetobacter phage Presley TaxID=1406780 RepID=U5PZU0_9CAUD|nr:hypothetical protein Presley_11 [Acinetobacter phage Presley]AGY48078.1 hypothetical protein Presley_11 [Acinetobacter phage Presley]